MTITANYTDAFRKYISQEWRGDHSNILQAQIYSRFGHAILIPFSFFSTIVDTAIAVGVTFSDLSSRIVSIVVGNKYAYSHLETLTKYSGMIISRPFLHFVRVINPGTNFLETKDPILSFGVETIQKFAKELSAGNLIVRHLFSRVICVSILPLACLATRITDFAIGIFAAVLTVVTLGLIESVNEIAMRGLRLPGIVSDLTKCGLLCIDPWTNI